MTTTVPNVIYGTARLNMSTNTENIHCMVLLIPDGNDSGVILASDKARPMIRLQMTILIMVDLIDAPMDKNSVEQASLKTSL